MRVAITGASGLVGGNLAVLLRQRGDEVVCTRRAASAIAHLDGLGIEWREAELADVPALAHAFAGCEVVFHCAAAVTIRRKLSSWIYAANVQGTANVIEAVRRAKVGRLVHCSTVSASAISETGRPVTEAEPYNFAAHGLDDAYSRTKRESQELVLAAARADVDAVVVQPSYMFGPYDAKPSSGALILNLARRRVPGHTSGMNSFVDVRDVCRGMIAAAERGKRGEVYILGGHNQSYAAIFGLIARVVGVKPPRFAVPRLVARALGRVGDVYQLATDKDAFINSITARYAFCQGYQFSSDKARRELGYELSPLEPAIRDAVTWFRGQGMLG